MVKSYSQGCSAPVRLAASNTETAKDLSSAFCDCYIPLGASIIPIIQDERHKRHDCKVGDLGETTRTDRLGGLECTSLSEAQSPVWQLGCKLERKHTTSCLVRSPRGAEWHGVEMAGTRPFEHESMLLSKPIVPWAKSQKSSSDAFAVIIPRYAE